MSLQNKKQLTEIFRTCQKNIKLNVVFRSSNRIRNAFRFKDQIPKYMNSKVIYKFKCNICNDVYIGETKRHFLVREYEYLGKSILTYKSILKMQITVVLFHRIHLWVFLRLSHFDSRPRDLFDSCRGFGIRIRMKLGIMTKLVFL